MQGRVGKTWQKGKGGVKWRLEQDFHEGRVWSFGYWTRENLGERKGMVQV